MCFDWISTDFANFGRYFFPTLVFRGTLKAPRNSVIPQNGLTIDTLNDHWVYMMGPRGYRYILQILAWGGQGVICAAFRVFSCGTSLTGINRSGRERTRKSTSHATSSPYIVGSLNGPQPPFSPNQRTFSNSIPHQLL